MDCYSFVFCHQQRIYRIVRDHPTFTVLHWERRKAATQNRPTRFAGPSGVTSAPTIYSAKITTSSSCVWTAAAHSFATTGRVSSVFSSSPYTIQSQDQPTACLLHILAERQLRFRVSATPRDREVCWQGNIALSRTYYIVLLPPPPLSFVCVLIFLGLVLLFSQVQGVSFCLAFSVRPVF